MPRIGGGAVAADFGVDVGAAGARVGEFFEDEDAGAFADDEAGAGGVEGPGREVRVRVRGCAEGARAREAG